jgi:HK97 family phage prohead protease
MKLEYLTIPFELKAAGGDAPRGTIEGYGSVFGGLDSYKDTIAKGAFKQTLRDWKAKGKLPKMLLQHGGGGFFGGNATDMVPVGQWQDMREDDTGLWMRGVLFDTGTDRAKDTYAAAAAGEMDGLSIGFNTKKSTLDEETGVRTLTEIKLWEVSLVTFPADDAARVTGVKTDGELPTEREFERFLRREAGFTEAEAKTIIAKGYRQVRREAMPSEEACGELLAAIRRYGSIAGEQRL